MPLNPAGQSWIGAGGLFVNGNVGIGTTGPYGKFQIGAPMGASTGALSNDVNIFAAYNASRGNLIYFTKTMLLLLIMVGSNCD